MSAVEWGRGREVWSEVEPFMLLGRVGAVPSTVRAEEEPRAHRKSRSTANLVVLPDEDA